MPLFASRPFLALWAIAVIARYGAMIPFIAGSDGLDYAQGVPSWLTSTYTLLILSALAVLEIVATKNNDLQQLMNQFDSVFKGMVAFLITFSLVNAESMELLENVGVLVPGAMAFTAAAISSEQVMVYGLSLLAAAGVWLLAEFRKQLLNILVDIDPEDHLRLQKLISWWEDTWVIAGIPIMLFFPILALVVFGLTLAGLFVVQKYVERQDEKTKIPCTTCGTLIYPSATVCFSCGTRNEQVRKVGMFGQPTDAPVTEQADHRVNLVARRRCPVCATRLRKRAIQQQCPTCETTTFASAADVNIYLRALRWRLPRTLLICLGLSFIPVLGLIPGIIYYRLSLIASLQRYIPANVGCLVRWPVRMLNLLLVCLQPIPILGSLVVPLMCLSNYVVYQRILEREKEQTFSQAQDEPVDSSLLTA
jgi:Zn finger protein HypA/HybF involved in hydrogenase expression